MNKSKTKPISEVNQERVNQQVKWGEQNHSPEKWMLIIGEEYGETCKEILEGNLDLYEKELIQLAASCVTALQCYYRNKEN